MNGMAMAFFAARASTAFSPSRSFVRRSFSHLLASDNDFDGFSSKVRACELVRMAAHPKDKNMSQQIH